MHYQVYTLREPDPGPTGAGDVQGVAELRDKYVQVGALTGTVKLEGSQDDGTTWVDLVSPLVANSIASVPQTVSRVRLNRTAGGAAVVLIAGFEVRGNA